MGIERGLQRIRITIGEPDEPTGPRPERHQLAARRGDDRRECRHQGIHPREGRSHWHDRDRSWLRTARGADQLSIPGGHAMVLRGNAHGDTPGDRGG